MSGTSEAVVLDASAAIEALLGEEVWTHGEGFHAHAGLDIEVLSVLRRLTMRNSVPAHAAREALEAFAALQITRHPLRRLIPRIWSLREDVSAHDAGYVALAEALDVPLLTADRRLAKTATRYCDVVVL
ncbi:MULTISPECIES: type II toxin-antitoxin system VapC family toxin [Microbacterium]|uniref:type II toxin-antitoxin system VapC family toxin n=1 Tax=Microbacterium TaxID=33882 RepID=UPI002286802C|nr:MULTISPECIES: type II toxin-antitoxin system VapC family toxin [Microbacterium]MCZ0711507.1 type II toxin-antitoxin system VapC family toxin [Microbacterium paraoxydans]MDH5134425.1 type II toxin-antitoxin system VapC family toxin [Microbacterium sp. RD10]MDH5138028.1 type II toxin-antitoxin system VapC family toxin [Microbacterium sp. RD11]MDH5145728.1 type II toxin-antitoxin system VapC family toxin [Microbacterium sp. RD12]MDH5156099.1 type II toxin-antitoxin system VapC family toxin [Mi